MSKIVVELEVDPNDKGTVRIKGIKTGLDDLGKSGKGAGANVGDSLERGLVGAQTKALQLQSTFKSIMATGGGKSPLDPISRDAARAQGQAFQLQRELTRIYGLQQRGGDKTFLDALAKDALVAETRLKALNQEALRLKALQLGRGQSLTPGGGSGGNAGQISQGAAGALGIPLSVGAASAAVTLAGYAGTRKLIDAGREATDTQRLLQASATESGVAYDALSDKAENFGRLMALSNNQARRTFADITRLAQQAGRTDELDRLAKSFADLAAARGIAAKDVSTITRQILSGQDEGLNRLGLPDPSKIYDAFARANGKTVESLTQTQKVAAITDLVMRKAALFDGEAEKRLADVGGKLDTVSAKFQNLVATVGSAATRRGGPLDSLLSGVLFAANGFQSTPQRTVSAEAAVATAKEIVDAQRAQEAAIQEALKNPYGSLSNLTLSKAARFITPFTSQEDRTKFIEQATREATEVRDELEQSFKRLFKDGERTTLQTLGFARQEFDTRGGILDEGTRAEILTKLDDLTKQIQDKLRAARKELSGLTAGLLVESNKENPFVGLFVKARTDAEALREKIAELRPVFEQMGDAAVDAFDRSAKTALELQKQITANALAAARFQSQSSALRQQQEARRLRDPQVGLSGPDERELDVFRARTTAAANIPRLLAEAARLQPNKQFQTPFQQSFDAQRLFRDQLSNLLALRGGATGKLGEAERRVLNEEILSLTGQIDPRVLATGAHPLIRAARDARVGALRGTAAQYRNDIEDALERQRAGARLQTDAREQLRLLQSSGLNDEEKLRQFLAITGTLSERELTGDLRLGRARALDESARIESAREAAGEARARKLERFIDTFTGLLGANGLKVDAPPSNVSVTVGDGLELEELLGPAMRPEVRRGEEQ